MSDSHNAPTSVSSNPKQHLTCYFRTSSNGNVDAVEKDGISGKISLFQEKGKKSSYLLQPQKQEGKEGSSDDNEQIHYHTIPRPAHLIIEHTEPLTDDASTETKRNCPFFFGGLQIVFSGKTVEIYLTNPDGKETYLMTCKGIPYRMNKKELGGKSAPIKISHVAEWHRAICVVPGGPRSISRLRIKLAGSVSAKDSTTVRLHYMKLTARMVNHSQASTDGTTTKMPGTNTNSQRVEQNKRNLHSSTMPIPGPTANSQRVEQNQRNTNHSLMTSMAGNKGAPQSQPPLTQSDLGAAMAGLSFMARKTEENMTELFKQQSKQMEENIESFFAKMQMQMYTLNSTISVQQQLIKENQNIMKEQQKMIEHQTNQIQKLVDDNHDLKVKMQSLHVEFSLLGSGGSFYNYNVDEVKTTRNVDERQVEDGHSTEDDMINKINAVISSHVSPSMASLGINNMVNDVDGDEDCIQTPHVEGENREEDYDNTANIEVTLVEDDSNDMGGGTDDDYEDFSREDKLPT
eukprot:jgi/Psemu1/324469/estExt_fgenesh1_pg.C_1480001